jgi:hypothetical protein
MCLDVPYQSGGSYKIVLFCPAQTPLLNTQNNAIFYFGTTPFSIHLLSYYKASTPTRRETTLE